MHCTTEGIILRIHIDLRTASKSRLVFADRAPKLVEASAATAVTVPSDKPQHIRAAVPNLIEEGSASELDDLHIAFGNRNAEGSVPVVSADSRLFATQLAALEHSGLVCERIFVDALLLPSQPDTVTLLIHDDRALLRWGMHHGGAINIEAVEPLLVSLINAIDCRRVQVLYSHEHSAEVDVFLENDLPALQQRYTLMADKRAFEGSLLDFFAQCLQQSMPAVDLRQGDFALPLDSGITWRRWRPVACVVGGLAAAQLVLFLSLGLYLQNEARTTHTAAEKLYRELFPNDRRVVDLQRQLQAQLGSLSGNEHKPFLELFGRLADEIQKSSGTPSIQLKAVTYDAVSGALQVDLTIGNVQALDNLQKRLAAIAGVDIPDIKLVPLDRLDKLPQINLPNEEFAFGIRRFDRNAGTRVHMEDFAQILVKYPHDKYNSANYGQIGQIIYQYTGDGLGNAQQFARRLLVNILLANGDAHLKNWSLIYADKVTPELAPIYDIVTTKVYIDGEREFALNLGRTKEWYQVTMAHFQAWAEKEDIP